MASGLAYGGNSQVTAVCYVHNAGTTSVKINSIQIFIEGASAVGPLNPNNCSGATLGPGKNCRAVLQAIETLPYGCKVTVTKKVDIRATFEIRDVSAKTLVHDALR